MRLACLALLALAFPALADPAADEAAIRQRFLDWTAAFNARDAAGACDLFAPGLAYDMPDQLGGTQGFMLAFDCQSAASFASLKTPWLR